MNCLIAAATTKEISAFLDHYRSSRNRQDIDILITGIGLTATTYSLAKQISLKKPGLIIQAGIAGCFDKNISPGSVVVVKQDCIADQSVIENKQLKTMFDTGFIKPNQFPFSKGWLMNPHKALIQQTKLKAVKSISVNHITTSRQMTDLYRDKFQPVLESMEGASLHYVCLLERVPFLQIRSISNYIGERDKKKWNMKDAITNLNKKLVELIQI
ncbi:MAG: futalosine hydrolase [Bacteroidota bacterium]|nr:futalosine hydrolase [Bacteroidota bacterium]